MSTPIAPQPGTFIQDDEAGMRAALAWSATGLGWTSPRPSVGCALVKDGKLIGGGHTQPGDGNPHAEIMALRMAQENNLSTQRATAYVTLEPCSHFGTTPPCTNALIEAGIARVVCGVGDPNPCVNGKGFELLREAGIEVTENFMAPQCARAQDAFLKHIVTGLPLVTLKCAVSLDGKIAAHTGHSMWITGEESRRRAHELRHAHDAILVGIGTVLADNPQLSVRLEGKWKQPQKIVLDSQGRIPLNAKLLDASTQIVTISMPEEKQKELEARGVRVLRCEANEHGHIDLPALWRVFGQQKICSVLIEGGAGVATDALRSRTVDKVECFVAPKFIGNDGLAAIGALDLKTVNDAPTLHDVEIERFGNDVSISGYYTKLY